MIDYLHDTYGICAADKCKCLKSGWYGRECPNWTPIGLNSFEEMIAKAREIKNILDNISKR